MYRWNWLTIVLVLLGACSQEPAGTDTDTSVGSTPAAIEHSPAKGIAWFDGSVDAAFEYAARTGKPIYLYWGAEWCPPCHAIAATVFSRPEFIERSKLFVPVYLDGDLPNAQALGERFGVLGYPTMIVFDSGGKELTRIPGGIDIEAYARILDLTQSGSSSTTSVVDRLRSGAATISASDCQLLAYHSWEQDTSILADFDKAAAFRQMYGACPAERRVERSMLYLAWLQATLDSQEEGPGLTVDQRAEGLGWLSEIVDEPELTRANILTVLFSGPDFVKALTDAGSSERAGLVAGFYDMFDRIAADESIYKRERIYTLIGRLGFERIDDDQAPVSEELADRIRTMATWADESTPSVYERQAIINAVANVLDEAGMDDLAKPMLVAELEKSQQPYYFMVDLASIEQRAGDTDAALEWLREAYASTRGPATRFQWGYYYAEGLLEMAPGDTGKIQDTVVGLITELQDAGGFYLRPKRQLASLESLLLDWGKMHADALTELRDAVHAVCAQIPTDDDSCETFLEDV